MPPKAAQKKKEQIIEDKTFGLKNKNKSAKVNRYVEEVKKQVQVAGNRKEREAAERLKKEKEEKKRAEESKKAEIAALFKPVITQKVPFGVDPKTVLCLHFKAGSCAKGTRCKFSHDLNIERKSAKANVYVDAREEEEKKQETMEDWDQAKLEDAVRQKQDKADNKNKPTDIVCKFFIDAIETRKYGWFWECPNGQTCKYRHALPPGFVLKKKETEEERRAREAEEKENEITIEDFLETERHKLGPDLTPVTAESFAKWKAERKARIETERMDELAKKQEEYKKMRAGMKTGMTFSGKELFEFNPSWAENDVDEVGALEEYGREDSEHGDDENEYQDADARGESAYDLTVEDLDDGGQGSSSGVAVDAELFGGDELAGLDDDDDDDDDDDEAAATAAADNNE